MLEQFDLEWPNLAGYTGGEKHITRGSATFPSKGGRDPSVLKIWDPYLRPNGFTQSDQIWYGIAYVA